MLVLQVICILFTSIGLANKVQCEINLRYESLAGDELVLLQDKLLLPTTRTDLNDMTSTKGRVVLHPGTSLL